MYQASKLSVTKMLMGPQDKKSKYCCTLISCFTSTWHPHDILYKYTQVNVCKAHMRKGNTTVKVVIFACVIFRASAIFDIFACF